jgi:hypothetical protein
MAGNHSRGFVRLLRCRSPVLALAGGCNHSRSTPKDVIAASDEVSQVLVGKRITIYGKFSLLGKIGPSVVLDNLEKV